MNDSVRTFTIDGQIVPIQHLEKFSHKDKDYIIYDLTVLDARLSQYVVFSYKSYRQWEMVFQHADQNIQNQIIDKIVDVELTNALHAALLGMTIAEYDKLRVFIHDAEISRIQSDNILGVTMQNAIKQLIFVIEQLNAHSTIIQAAKDISERNTNPENPKEFDSEVLHELSEDYVQFARQQIIEIKSFIRKFEIKRLENVLLAEEDEEKKLLLQTIIDRYKTDESGQHTFLERDDDLPIM